MSPADRMKYGDWTPEQVEVLLPLIAEDLGGQTEND
jgi:hypothetical protein